MLLGQPLHPLQHALQIFTDVSKEGLGIRLNKCTTRVNLFPSRKQGTHQSSGTKGSLSGPKRVSGPLFEYHSSHSHRLHHSGCLHK